MKAYPCGLLLVNVGLAFLRPTSDAFSFHRHTTINVPINNYHALRIRHLAVSTTPTTAAVEQHDETKTTESLLLDVAIAVDPDATSNSFSALARSLSSKIGTVADDRMLFTEYNSGRVPRLLSHLRYNDSAATHVAGSVASAALLVAGTTVGAGVLALPAATAATGFLPSSAALLMAWVYMSASGLLIAELTLNRMAETGRPGLGLLELYQSSLNAPLAKVGSAAYLFLHYAMMVAYVAQGGVNIDNLLTSVGLEQMANVPGIGQLVFAGTCGLALYATQQSVVEKVNNVLVAAVGATFMAIVAIGAQTADFGALIDPVNQHPSQVANCLPILFLSLVFQNVVPTIVEQLEGDRSKITKAIIGGTAAPLLMFLMWNAVVLGNVVGSDLTSLDPIALLQSGAAGGETLGPLVSAFSSLALITSVIGFTYGLLDAWTDIFSINQKSKEFDEKKAPLFALIFGLPLALSVSNPDIFYRALEYGGAFGVSTLFLVLPPIMVWKERYGDEQKLLVTQPMVPFGKLTLGSMWKAAATLVIEQGAEKLGIIDLVKEHFFSA
jgi:tyrosine-specific transport protein